MTLPVVGQENAAQVRVSLEADSEHVVAFALHPVGAAPHRTERRAARLPRSELRLHEHGETRLEVLHARHHFQPLLLPVHGGEEGEVHAAERLPGETARLPPPVGRGFHHEEGALSGGGDPQPLLDESASLRVRQHRMPGQIASQTRPERGRSPRRTWLFEPRGLATRRGLNRAFEPRGLATRQGLNRAFEPRGLATRRGLSRSYVEDCGRPRTWLFELSREAVRRGLNESGEASWPGTSRSSRWVPRAGPSGGSGRSSPEA